MQEIFLFQNVQGVSLAYLFSYSVSGIIAWGSSWGVNLISGVIPPLYVPSWRGRGKLLTSGLLGALGAFAILRKATVGHVMCVCPSAWNNSAPSGRILMKLDTYAFYFFQKSVDNIQVLFTSDKNNLYFTLRRFRIYDDISLNSS